jgi:Fructosamine-3-kinase
MRNGIKPQLSEKQLDAIARHVCDKPAVLMKELTDGWANAAYLVALADGTEMIVKAAPEQGTSMMRYEQGLMRTEAETMRLVGTAGTIPVPRILAYDDTLRVVAYEYMVMEKLEGAPYNKVKESLSEAERSRLRKSSAFIAGGSMRSRASGSAFMPRPRKRELPGRKYFKTC